jgi:glycosyltransferase involved in cell wall biosynthesis
MRIAQVSPLHESCPPQLYGGTERVVSYLTEELVRQGHEVTLFASGDSVTNATLRAPCDRALRLDPRCKDPLPRHLVMLNRVARSAEAFDIIHFHADFLHFPLFARLWGKTVTTAHGRLDLPDLQPLFREFPMMPLVSISDAQRAPVPWASWQGTVHHGLPTDLYLPGRGDGGYLAFIGRISPEKGVENAIKIARRAGIPLKIAAKVDKADLDYYNAKIKRLLKGPGVEFIDEIGDRDKGEFLGRAMALFSRSTGRNPSGWS